MLAIKSLKHLYYLLQTSEKELKEILDNLDNFYQPYQKSKKKKDGTIRTKNGIVETRIICPSIGRLKEIQYRIKTQILRKYEFQDFVHGGVKGKDNITNANVHKGNKYFFTTDLKDFFPSVNHRIVYQTFFKNGFSADVSSALTKLTTYQGNIPQGIPTSTYITNLTALPLDYELIILCNENEIKYTRFVDDLSFSSKKDFKKLTEQIIETIKKHKYKINDRKTLYKIGPKEITGVEVRNNLIKASKGIFERYETATTENRKQGLRNYIERFKKK
jgi:RNA-directed DNA polymerase